MANRVFVSGTLQDDERAAAVLDRAPTWDGPAVLEGCHRVDGTDPSLVPSGSVRGRSLAVDPPGLSRLDRYEGIGQNLYVRVAIGTASNCWTDIGDPDRLGLETDPWPGTGPFENVSPGSSRTPH